MINESFICLHYNVKKYDSQFWIDLQNIELPELKDKLNIWQEFQLQTIFLIMIIHYSTINIGQMY